MMMQARSQVFAMMEWMQSMMFVWSLVGVVLIAALLVAIVKMLQK